MSVKCQLCDSEATVHEVVVRSGVRMERHLCEQCARTHGLAVQPINEIIGQYLVGGGVPAPKQPTQHAKPKPESCPGCGMTMAEFKQSGLLGCPECYAALAGPLMPLIERAHGGATQHVGKQPVHHAARAAHAPGSPGGDAAACAEERAKRMRALRQQLDDAVRQELYERAAKIRDELRRLQTARPGDTIPTDALGATDPIIAPERGAPDPGGRPN